MRLDSIDFGYENMCHWWECTEPINARGFCPRHYAATRYGHRTNDDVDWVNVDYAVEGHPVGVLTPAERREVVRVLRDRGFSYTQMAVRAGCSDRHIARIVKEIKEESIEGVGDAA